MSAAVQSSNVAFAREIWAVNAVSFSTSSATRADKITDHDKEAFDFEVRSDFTTAQAETNWAVIQATNVPPDMTTMLKVESAPLKRGVALEFLKEIVRADNHFAMFCQAASFVLGGAGVASSFGLWSALFGGLCGVGLFILSTRYRES